MNDVEIKGQNTNKKSKRQRKACFCAKDYCVCD